MLSIGTPNENLYKPTKTAEDDSKQNGYRSNANTHLSLVRSASFSNLMAKPNKPKKLNETIEGTTKTGTRKNIEKLLINNNQYEIKNNLNIKTKYPSHSFLNYLVNTPNVALNLRRQLHQQLIQQQQNHNQNFQSNGQDNLIRKSTRPIVIAGPSGSGKSTLIKKLMEKFPDCFRFSISHTTRKPREGEQNGKNYYFVEPKVFESMIENEEFIEYTKFSNNYYGTSKQTLKDIEASGKICILDVEIDGVRSFKKTDLNPRFIFIKPPSIEVLEQRLRNRETETDESIKRRLARAHEELRFGEIDGMFDIIITNDDFDEAFDSLRKFVVEDIEALKKSRGI